MNAARMNIKTGRIKRKTGEVKKIAGRQGPCVAPSRKNKLHPTMANLYEPSNSLQMTILSTR